MKTKSLRAWIIALLACIVGSAVYSTCWRWMPHSQFATYLSISVYTLVPFCELMLGLLFAKDDASPQAKRGGILYAIAGIIGLLLQALVLFSQIVSTNLMTMPVHLTSVALCAVLISAAFILIALSFSDRRLLVWAIVYAVFKVAFAVALSACRLISDNHLLFSIYGLAAVGVDVCLLGYFIKMLKLLKR